jgi:hypothetical protein
MVKTFDGCIAIVQHRMFKDVCCQDFHLESLESFFLRCWNLTSKQTLVFRIRWIFLTQTREAFVFQSIDYFSTRDARGNGKVKSLNGLISRNARRVGAVNALIVRHNEMCSKFVARRTRNFGDVGIGM